MYHERGNEMELFLFQGLSKLTTKRLRKQAGRKTRKEEQRKVTMESLEIHIDRNIARVFRELFLFPSLFFFLCPERKRTLLFRQLAYNARRQHFWEQYEERERGRVRPREQKGAKGRDFAARTIINGFDSNFLFVCPPLMFLFVDRSSPTSCNLFPRCLFIFFPTFPFQTFRLLLIYRVKDEVSTCEDSRLLVKRFFFQAVKFHRRYIY